MTARKLILAEKPQVGRDLARVLGVSGRGDGSLVSERYVITWCIGHLVELCEPHEYDAAWKPWRLDRLPMLPRPFKLRPIRTSLRQWKVVRELLRDRSFASVVNACDAGREGELIFRLCYELAGCRLPIERLWISSLTEQAIGQGMSSLRPGREFDDLGRAARCRSEADWLVGMNATRAVTVWRRGEQGVLCSLGRVQTPTLGILVHREQAIRRFVPSDYFEVQARLSRTDAPAHDNTPFVALWQMGKLRRLAERPPAEELVRRDTTSPICIESVEEKRLREPPPLLFDLTSLQRTCNRRFGWSAQHTLSQAQRLYEEHKLLSYPRTDSRYLGRDLIAQLPRLFAAVAESPEYSCFAQSLERVTPPRRVFQDQRVTDHHAIIPTTTTLTAARLAALSGDQRKLHDLVVRRFLGAFFPDAEFAQTTVVVRVDAVAVDGPPSALPKADADGRLAVLPAPPDRYQAQGKQRLLAGWQEVAGFDGEGPARRKVGSEDQDSDEDADDASQNQVLPRLREGERLSGVFSVLSKQTRPPPRYSDASLLSAMESAGKQLSDDDLRRAMKDTGLGTPATRAAVIETLIARCYVERRGKQLWPTELGMDLIDKLPEASLASAELTGQWESRLHRMAHGEDSATEFMAGIVSYVEQLVGKVRGTPPPAAIPVRDAKAGASDPASGRRVSSAKGRRAGVGAAAKSPSPIKSARRGGAAVPAVSSARKEPASEASHAPGSPVVPTLRCPRCNAAALIWGRSAWGCGDYRTCRLVIPFAVAGLYLSTKNLAALVGSGRTQLTRHGQRLALRLRATEDPALVVTSLASRASAESASEVERR